MDDLYEEDGKFYEEVMCLTCSGSGEGMADGTHCSHCGGSGVEYIETEAYQSNED